MFFGKRRIPPVGMRILKSAAAMELCYLVSFLRGNRGIVFYSQLAALWCIQMYTSGTLKNAGQRLTGTVIGALYGLLYLLVRLGCINGREMPQMLNSLIISGMIVLVLYTTVLMKSFGSGTDGTGGTAPKIPSSELCEKSAAKRC